LPTRDGRQNLGSAERLKLMSVFTQSAREVLLKPLQSLHVAYAGLTPVKNRKMHLNQPTDSRMIAFPVLGSIVPRLEEISKFFSNSVIWKKRRPGKMFPMAF
jgi:hypothetical protein